MLIRHYIIPGLKPLFKKTVPLVKKIFSFLPGIVWNAFGIIGVLIVGLVLGFVIGGIAVEDVNNEDLVMENEKLHRLINGYENLSRLYSLQGENMGVMLDPNILYNYPEEYAEALSSARQYENDILVQYGRVLELRRAADLPETYNERSD